MGKRTKGNVIMNLEVEEITPKESFTLSRGASEVQEYKSLAERVAEDNLYYRNYYYPGGKQAFPFHQRLHMVDKYFPYAKGGPLFIDELTRVDDESIFKEKELTMKTLGHRYIAIKPGMTELEVIERLV